MEGILMIKKRKVMSVYKKAVLINVALKGHGKVDSFIANYTMLEHFQRLPSKHGHSYAANHLKFTDFSYCVTPTEFDNEELEIVLAKHLGIDRERTHFISRIMNPMEYDTNCYREIELLGYKLLVSRSYSFGFRYGYLVPEWEEEYKQLKMANSYIEVAA